MIFDNEGIEREIIPYIFGRLLSLISFLSLMIISYALLSKSTLYMEVSIKLKLLLISMIMLSYIMYKDRLRILYGAFILPIVTLLYYLLLTSSNFALNVMVSFNIFLLTCGLYCDSKRLMIPLGYCSFIFLPQFVFQYNLLSLLLLTIRLDIIERIFLATGTALLLYKLSSYLKGPIFNLWMLCFQKLMRESNMIKNSLSKLNYLLNKDIRQYLYKKEIVIIHKIPLKISYKVIVRKIIIAYEHYQLRIFASLMNVLNVLANINIEIHMPAIVRATKNLVKQLLLIERKTLNILKNISKYLEHVQKSIEHSLTLSSFLIGLIILTIVLIYLVLMYLT